ncbi:MAG: adenylosuccinate synthetase [Cyanobacteria bacterium J06639_16]
MSTVKTFLSQQMAITPFNRLKEASVPQNNGIFNPLQRLTIDGRCPVVTLWHKIINRAQELHRGDRRFGSTGMGVGATFIYARSHPNTTLTAWNLVDHRRLSEKVDALYDYVHKRLQPLSESPEVAQYLNEESAWLDPQRVIDALMKIGQRLAPCTLNAEAAETYLEQCLLSGNTVLEGAQGTLLDYQVGTVPLL